MWGLIVIQWLHVLLGIFWFGSTLYVDFVVIPAVGKTWQHAGLGGQIVKALVTSRVSPGTVYAGTKPACLFVSHDNDTNWTELPSFRRIPGRRFWFSPAEKPFSAYVQAIALSPTDPQTILVGIEAGAVVAQRGGSLA